MGWLRNKPATREQVAELERKVDKLMATQADIAAQLRAQNASLKAISDGIDKVGTETDQVLKEVQDLKDVIANQDVVSPELQSAVDDVAAAVDSLKTHVTAVDDKVPDVIPTPVP